MINHAELVLKILNDKKSKIKKIESESVIKECYEVDGIEYYIYDKKENYKMDDLVRCQTEGIDRRFILIYKSYTELFKDEIQDKSLERKLGISKKDLRQTISLLKANSIIHYESKEIIDIILDDFGANYLTYVSTDARGDVFSISIYDLLRLFEEQGNNLFLNNIREGLVKTGSNNTLLYESFKAQFFNEFIKYLKQLYKIDTKYISDILKSRIDIDEDEIRKQKNVDFWFKHNGITMVGKNADSITHCSTILRIKTGEVQIVNGAQTISRWYELRDKAMEIINNEIDDLNSTVVDEFLRKIWVKTILIRPISGSYKDDNFIDEVTIGLNTQTPIFGPDIFVKQTPKVYELKIILRRAGIEIVSTGKIPNNRIYFELKQIVQLYLCSIGKPGSSRNLSIKDLKNENTINEMLEKFSSEKNDDLSRFSSFLNLQNSIEDFWIKQRKKTESDNSIKNQFELNDVENYKVLLANGLSYFKAYIFQEVDFNSLEMNESFEELNKIFVCFSNDFYKGLCESQDVKILDSNLFKKDYFFREYLYNNRVSNIRQLDGVETINGLLLKMKFKLDKNYKSSNFSNIKKFLKGNNIELNNYRTITSNKNGVTEAFSFPSSSFIDLVNKINESDDENDLKFENSHFHKYIVLDYYLFVYFEEEEIFKLIKFNFKKYENDAKAVYEKVVDKLREDDYSFPKQSDNLSFHVRPKALDSNDKIIMPNETKEVKKTFWANKETMNEIIKESLKK